MMFAWGFFPVPEKPEPEPKPKKLTEQEVEQMRHFDLFMEMGFEPIEAFALVANRVSPSEMREMIKHGADARTAASILI